MPKDKSYIDKMSKVCECDIRLGNRHKLEIRLKESIENEDYETAEAIQRAFDNYETYKDVKQ